MWFVVSFSVLSQEKIGAGNYVHIVQAQLLRGDILYPYNQQGMILKMVPLVIIIIIIII